MNVIRWLDQRRHWWKVFLLIFGVSIAVVGYIGVKTYEHAPPVTDFVDRDGQAVFSAADILAGQQLFLSRGLMEYGSFLGDGGMRGPDFSAEALDQTARAMRVHLDAAWAERLPDPDERGAMVTSLVQRELKTNAYDPGHPGLAAHGHEPGAVVLSAAQVAAFASLKEFYRRKFAPSAGETVPGTHTDQVFGDPQQLHRLSAFFFWGGWLCAARRPGEAYSYTHNWPFDPDAGNLPHGGLVLWSVIGVLVVVATIGLLFYYYGKLDREAVLEQQQARLPPFATTAVVDRFKPTATQRATFRFFAVAALLFLFQVTAGLLTIGNFLGLGDLLPVTVVRTWHSQISVLWIAVCWFAATIWVLPLICRPEPRGQLACVKLLFWMLVVVAAGGTLGIPMGISGVLSAEQTHWLGLQGWEYLQLGRLYQIILYASFCLWLLIVVRGLWPALLQRQTWSLPNWMVYAIVGIIFMFSASFVAGPETNFVVADFWRWCTIHMWVEAFFELFTTIIVAYFLYLMGFVSHLVAARVVYLSAVLFLGSGLIGISHNFYWNGKSMETVALGGVLSSLQVAPLVLLTIEAWRFRNLPQTTMQRLGAQGGDSGFGLSHAFLFLIGVNFWNFFGAGVLGFLINLPIINYYQHGTYLTVNHGHAALMGVYGNLAIAAMLFCGRWNIDRSAWNGRPLLWSFWSLNIGLMLMVVFDLFPVGVHQLSTVMEQGYAHARSEAYIGGDTFQFLTWMRGFGVVVFYLGGVLPLVWFMVSRWFRLRPAQSGDERFVVPPSVLAVSGPSALAEGVGAEAAR